MPIPDYQTLMLPLLEVAADGSEQSFRTSVERLAEEFSLTPEERRELLPSGRYPTFDNRVGWASTYLRKAGLLETTRRGYFRITDRGRQTLRENPDRLDVRYLSRFELFREFHGRKESAEDAGAAGPDVVEKAGLTPEEAIEAAFQRLRNQLADELLTQVKSCSPAFFERLVIEVLLRMGYGGSRKDAGQAIGRSGDGGIDGIINEDRLGLDVIYIQAKRWEGTVGRPEVQKFVGALHGQRARKGVFITTSSFTSEARAYSQMIENKVVLVDGDTLANLMIDHSVGVSGVSTYEVKKIDSDYFLEG